MKIRFGNVGAVNVQFFLLLFGTKISTFDVDSKKNVGNVSEL